jgi:hypothetical protein
MTNPVLIGLAVTSHDAALTTVAEFSNVSITGTVTGSWQAAAIGAAMPTNGAAPLYLTVQDKAGKTKTVVNPNPSAIVTAAWTEWRIPLSDLTGVSLTTVQKITLGVGDKTSPKTGATGMLYIDDIGFGKPAPGAMLDLRIAAGTDDAEEHLNAAMDITSTDLELVHEDAGTPATDEQLIGMRWLLPVAKGAGMTKAYIEFQLKEIKTTTNAAPVNVIIEGQLNPNPAAFTATAKDITNRPRTKAQVKWTIPTGMAVGDKFQTPDISSIVTELVSQSGWASGNALVILLRDDKGNPSTGLRCVWAYEGNQAAAPLLHLEMP